MRWTNIGALIAAAVLTACSGKSKPVQLVSSDTAVYYPYAPTYSRLEPGKPVLTKSVMEVWRAFETGNLSTVSNKFAPHVTLVFPGRILDGSRDSVLNLYQQVRDEYSGVQSYVDSWMPAYAVDKNEDLVFIWGHQSKLKKDGKKETMVMHEMWRFNKQGQITKMEQYVSVKW